MPFKQSKQHCNQANAVLQALPVLKSLAVLDLTT